MSGLDWLWAIPGLLTAIVLHEYAHGKVSTMLGDPTPKLQGRLTLNPLKHIDPIGLLMLWIFKFGWAKPVQVNPYYYKDPRKGMIYVALAGPLTNIAVAFVGLLSLYIAAALQAYTLQTVLYYVVIYNVWLAVFNLIPIPPLDGSKVLAGVLPPRYGQYIYDLEQYGWIILIALIWFGVISAILGPLANGLLSILDFLVRLVTLGVF